jgi:hypothetical protein
MLLSNTHTIAQILSINTIHIDNVTFRDVCTDTRKRNQSKMSGDGDKEAYKKNTWKALIGMRLNSNWSMEGQ